MIELWRLTISVEGGSWRTTSRILSSKTFLSLEEQIFPHTNSIQNRLKEPSLPRLEWIKRHVPVMNSENNSAYGSKRRAVWSQCNKHTDLDWTSEEISNFESPEWSDWDSSAAAISRDAQTGPEDHEMEFKANLKPISDCGEIIVRRLLSSCCNATCEDAKIRYEFGSFSPIVLFNYLFNDFKLLPITRCYHSPLSSPLPTTHPNPNWVFKSSQIWHGCSTRK